MHIAMICPPLRSHVAAMEAIAAGLARRGCRATLIQLPGTAPPPSRRPDFPFGLRRMIVAMAEATRRLCREGPEALEEVGADAVLGDQMEPAGAIAAARLGLPFASLACALPMELEPGFPLPVLPWRYDPSPRGLARNQAGLRVSDFLMHPLQQVIAEEGAASGLGPARRVADCASSLAGIWQLVPSLDFPRAAMPGHAHYVGPLRPPAAPDRGADLPQRGRRPLVYASLGTLQGHRLGLLRRIARACARADTELVVSHCGALAPAEAARIEAPHVFADLDQRAMIARADLVICHAGLNTVLDAAEAGVPVLALPIAFDQPGVAARVAHSGLGLVLDRRFATEGSMARAIGRLASEPGFREAAARIGAEIASSGGVDRAAAILERALATRRPVLRDAA